MNNSLRRTLAVGLAFALVLGLSGCARSIYFTGVVLSNPTVTTNLDLSSLYTGYRSVVGQWGSTAADRGVAVSAPGSAGFQVNAATGGAGSDLEYFPNDPAYIYQYGIVEQISVDIKQTLRSGANALCGIGIAFGNAAGHVNAVNLSRNLRMGGRDWTQSANATDPGVPRDLIRFYYSSSIANEGIYIDALVNDFNKASGNSWSTATWARNAGNFRVQYNTGVASTSDSITYGFKMVFDHVNHKIAITVGPPGTSPNAFVSNLATTGWVSQTVTWNLTAAQGTVESTEPRAGLDVTNVAAGFTHASLSNETIAFGLIANQQIRQCEFTNFLVTGH